MLLREVKRWSKLYHVKNEGIRKNYNDTLEDYK